MVITPFDPVSFLTPYAVIGVPPLTLKEFSAIDLNQWTKAQGLRMPWWQKLSFKFIQKRISKKIARGLLDGNTTLQQMQEQEQPKNANRRGGISLILGVAGLVFLFLGFLRILTIPLFVGGLVIGIRGIRKDQNKAMAIIGTIFSGLMLLLFLLALIILASWGFNFA